MTPRNTLIRTWALASCLCLFAATAAAQEAGTWQLLPNAPSASGRHDDATFIDAYTGWVVNTKGGIHKTSDGGETWTQQLQAGGSKDAIQFRSVGFANDQVGWVGSLTAGNLLYETRDGGDTWTNITSRISGPEPGGLCGMWVADEQTIYAVGAWWGSPRFIKSIDGGQTWFSRDMSAYAQTLVDVFFFDKQRGFIIGGSNTDLARTQAVILMTEDGGSTWTRRHLSSRAGEWGWKLSFPTPDVGYGSVEFFRGAYADAKVLKTTDGGLTWERMLIPGSDALQGMAFITPEVGWTSGRGTTSMTTDGGLSWATTTALDGSVNRIRVLGDTLAYAVGQRVYKYTAAMATATEPPEAPPMAFRLEQNHPNPFNPHTLIRYVLDEPSAVRLAVYDLRGRVVKTLVDWPQGRGGYEVRWEGRNTAGQAVAAGVYFYRLQVGATAETRRMVLAR